MRSSESMHRSMSHCMMRVACCISPSAGRAHWMRCDRRMPTLIRGMGMGSGSAAADCLCGGEPFDIEVAAEACECLPSLRPPTDTHTTLPSCSDSLLHCARGDSAL